jgi:hypothetical protein
MINYMGGVEENKMNSSLQKPLGTVLQHGATSLSLNWQHSARVLCVSLTFFNLPEFPTDFRRNVGWGWRIRR